MTIPTLPDPYWQNPEQTADLSLWAAALSEQGDPRGPYVEMCLAGASPDERTAVQKKLGGKLVGPARPCKT